MILGAILACLRCPFCDVSAWTRPRQMQTAEATKLAQTIADMGLRFVVVTSIDRDDLRDGSAQHFAATASAPFRENPSIKRSKRFGSSSAAAAWIAHLIF